LKSIKIKAKLKCFVGACSN